MVPSLKFNRSKPSLKNDFEVFNNNLIKENLKSNEKFVMLRSDVTHYSDKMYDWIKEAML